MGTESTTLGVAIPEWPLLKFAVRCTKEGNEVLVRYRGRAVRFHGAAACSVEKLIKLCDGRHSLEELSSGGDSNVRLLLGPMAANQMLLSGPDVLRQDERTSGKEAFWKLESLLLRWKYEKTHGFGANLLQQIAVGEASSAVVMGFFLEQSHLLRAVPEELSAAVLHAPSEQVRDLYMNFYDEESRHGQILHDALSGWFASGERISLAPPLPATGGLIRTYRTWAEKSPLLYAVALMRDESSPLDEEMEFDPYAGARCYYDVPSRVVDAFEWHANLDRSNDHGFFPEKIFACFPEIDSWTLRKLTSALREIVDLHDLLHWNILEYYSKFDVEARIAAAEAIP